MTFALTRQPALSLENGEVTYVSRQSIDLPLAFQQHEAYCQALRHMGVEVERLPSVEGHPDSVFIEDNAIILDELAVLSSMGTVSRQGEIDFLLPVLSRHRSVVTISPPALLEGGDVCCIGKTLLVGISSRTNWLGVEALRAIVEPFGYRVTPIEIQGCLHLKTACTPLDDKTLLVNPTWLDLDALRHVQLVQVPSAEPLGANVLRLPQGILANAAFPRTLDLMKAEGHTVRDIEISEFLKAEAGLTCLSLIFD